MALLMAFILIWSIVINFFMYEQIQDLKTLREIEKNSYRQWLEEEVKKKRLYSNLYHKEKWKQKNVKTAEKY